MMTGRSIPFPPYFPIFQVIYIFIVSFRIQISPDGFERLLLSEQYEQIVPYCLFSQYKNCVDTHLDISHEEIRQHENEEYDRKGLCSESCTPVLFFLILSHI
jgi:hypothetical protein